MPASSKLVSMQEGRVDELGLGQLLVEGVGGGVGVPAGGQRGQVEDEGGGLTLHPNLRQELSLS